MLATTGTATNPFGYTGEYTDPSGLIYLRARYYDAATGQFLAVDPATDSTRQPYVYGGGDPINFTDPAGLMRVHDASGGSTPEEAAATTAAFAASVTGSGVDVPGGDPNTWNFAQKKFRETFDLNGKLAGKTVDDVAAEIRSGSRPTVDIIVRDGHVLILDTRTSAAYTRAGVPRKLWNFVNRTGQQDYEGRLSNQLKNNKLTSEGFRNPTSTTSGDPMMDETGDPAVGGGSDGGDIGGGAGDIGGFGDGLGLFFGPFPTNLFLNCQGPLARLLKGCTTTI